MNLLLFFLLVCYCWPPSTLLSLSLASITSETRPGMDWLKPVVVLLLSAAGVWLPVLLSSVQFDSVPWCSMCSLFQVSCCYCWSIWVVVPPIILVITVTVAIIGTSIVYFEDSYVHVDIIVKSPCKAAECLFLSRIWNFTSFDLIFCTLFIFSLISFLLFLSNFFICSSSAVHIRFNIIISFSPKFFFGCWAGEMILIKKNFLFRFARWSSIKIMIS